ncbi:MAG: hypothetical protein AABX51_08175 [Nanoarchaeota archaeon]
MDAKQVARTIFLLAAIYDFTLGLIFAFFHVQIFNYLGIPVPSDTQYLIGGALLIALFGVAFYFVYKSIDKNKDLYKMGIMFKALYVILALYFYFIVQSAHLIFFLFAIPDAIILVPLVLFYKKVYPNG